MVDALDRLLACDDPWTRYRTLVDSPAARAGAEALLWHWGPECDRKVYLFGAGTFFHRLKYPFVWYDVLHVADILSHFPFVHNDPRFLGMVETIVARRVRKAATPRGRCTGPGRAGHLRTRRRPRRGLHRVYTGRVRLATGQRWWILVHRLPMGRRSGEGERIRLTSARILH